MLNVHVSIAHVKKHLTMKCSLLINVRRVLFYHFADFTVFSFPLVGHHRALVLPQICFVLFQIRTVPCIRVVVLEERSDVYFRRVVDIAKEVVQVL